MPPYGQICRAVAVLMLLGTGLVVAAVVVIAVLAVFGLVILQQFYAQGEQIVPLQLVGWVAAVFVVPALLLMWFYFVVSTRVPSVAYATTGWIGSVAFHLALTVLFVTVLHGGIETSHSLLAMPLWGVTGLAAAMSAYLAVACRRPVVSVSTQ